MSTDGREGLRELLKRYLDAGASLSKASRAELEDMVREALRSSAAGRERVEDVLEDLRARSRRGIEQLGEVIRAEVRREFEARAARRRQELADFLERAVALVGEYLGVGRPTTPSASESAATEPAAKKAPARRAPATKAAGGKAPARKAPATKAAARKVSARKAPARSAGPDEPAAGA
ncbi:MAG TPA: hypothetical protein VKV23_02455 [Acidimicrobiales bacterium]|nr:hypothetical protein [Acidimicrobiales bacterium]